MHDERGSLVEQIMPSFSEAAATCPLESAIEVIAGRWKLLVLRSLFLGGPQRFNQLLHSVARISAKELTRNLRELENSGLVEHGPTPAHGTDAYHLSVLGQSLLPVFREIGSFGERLKKRKMSRGSWLNRHP
ncbi:helix-turn-helix domain-containing protein [Bradyrhizobium sp. 153]|uniref:winged helix-turn-helix transcriptional regulator n=1 Tax=Bradyrhizobium sp. 153 TaxID=2782627 RepID=UPI001FF999FB|nr:helix-turn-helix domain-containing protein [Bradyrhizobium sp. 153]MCK1667721.1 helix-turn-helix transcriptional regulator [Bradyrhizobium sp. 153]